MKSFWLNLLVASQIIGIDYTKVKYNSFNA